MSYNIIEFAFALGSLYNMSELADVHNSKMKGGKGSPRKKNKNGKKSVEVPINVLNNCVKGPETPETQLALLNGTTENAHSLENENCIEPKESVNVKSDNESSYENNVESSNIECNVSLKDQCKTSFEENNKLKDKTVNDALDKLAASLEAKVTVDDTIKYVSYHSELQMTEIIKLIQKDLSEPYSIYTYRYFIHNWPKLCFLAVRGERCVGAVVCKLDLHRKVVKRGYIAMLAVDQNFRKQKIGSRLVRQAIQVMMEDDADEVVLETEITNKPALRLYENLGFVRDKRLFRYYLNGVDALRLKLWLR